ncbi:nucleoside 2-deoxyribosyltransferase [Candidatus Parcubacteria bacterium]|nr:nucleoside 2-deoxyribosyltransferase [Candidatus Parcubacteria bacterium]
MIAQKTIFLSYRFTGENVHELTETLGKVLSALRSAGHTAYCSIEDATWFLEQKRTNKEILQHGLEQLDKSEVLLTFVRSNQKSEGMLLEVGYALGKGKRIALALKKGVDTTFLDEIADPIIQFESLDELCEKLAIIDF